MNKLVEDEMAESGIGSESIILAGFSQGGVVSLYCMYTRWNQADWVAGLLSEKKFGGIIGMSCYLARHKEFASVSAWSSRWMTAKLINANNAKTPILMCHGTSGV